MPLLNAGREEALKLASFHSAYSWGVEPLKNGFWGIRILTSQKEQAIKAIRPDDFATLTGVIYELGGFPEYMDEEGLTEFMGPVNPIVEITGSRRYGWGEFARRTFYVKTRDPIVWTLKQGDHFLVSCNVAPEKPYTPAKTCIYRFRGTGNQTTFPTLSTAATVVSATTLPSSVSTGRATGVKRALLSSSGDAMEVEDGKVASLPSAGIVPSAGAPLQKVQTPTVPLAIAVPSPGTQEMMTIFQTLMRDVLASMKLQLGNIAPMADQLDRITSKTEYLESLVLEGADDSMWVNPEERDEENSEGELEEADATGEKAGGRSGKGGRGKGNGKINAFRLF